MLSKSMAIAAALALAVPLTAPQAARAGFWSDLNRSLGAAAGNARRDGARAADAIGEGASDAADAVVEGAERAADFVSGNSGGPADTAPQPVPRPAPSEPAARDLSKDPLKQ
jgi:hypothetical protein